MTKLPTFDEVLDVVETLSTEDQAELVKLVRLRIAEKERERIIRDVEEARVEYQAGLGVETTVEDLMRELQG